jgi:hypothetical protein
MNIVHVHGQTFLTSRCKIALFTLVLLQVRVHSLQVLQEVYGRRESGLAQFTLVITMLLNLLVSFDRVFRVRCKVAILALVGHDGVFQR